MNEEHVVIKRLSHQEGDETMGTVIDPPNLAIVPRKKRKTKRTIPEKPQQPPQTSHTYRPQTALGRKLWKLRQQMLASGIPLLSWDELEHEIAERSGKRERDDT